MEIILLLIVGFVIWHFIPQRDPTQPSPEFRSESRAIASDPRWATYVEEHCESPAETAFLREMINGFSLKPDGGSLLGSGVRLDYQVVEGRYRTDFLADKWLVIEIDGATWHSSYDAVARDKLRDEYFESLGYSVLRIPAKVVFNQPGEAVKRVRAALAVGKRPQPVTVQKSGWQRLSETFTSISDGIDEMNNRLREKAAVQQGIQEAKLAFESEKLVVEAAITSANSKMKLKEWLERQNQSTRERYERSAEDTRKAMLDNRGHHGGQAHADTKMEARLFPTAPLLSENPEYHMAIEEAYNGIVDDRCKSLKAWRRSIGDNPRLAPLIEQQLRKWGCALYWNLLNDEPTETSSPYPRLISALRPAQEPSTD